MSEELADLLSRSGLASSEDLAAARAHGRGKDLSLADALLELGRIDPGQLARAQAKAAGLPFVDLTKGRVPADLLDRLPPEFAIENGVLPVAERGGKLIVAIGDPLAAHLADQLQFQLGQDVACALAQPSVLRDRLREAYGQLPGDAAASAARSPAEGADEAPIVRLVQRLFADALKARASDIHIEPSAAGLAVRYRIDGVLRPVAEHPHHLSGPLLSRLKVMGQMDIAERRKPQDGRISIQLDGREIDVRASILPSNHGETIVMRLLDRSANLISLTELGFDASDRAWFERIISRPNGIVLVTGPTGSGKTTTLYAALSELNRPDVKILTAEDPVEYHLSGVNQMQVSPKQGLTFARILRAMLRAAPNVILVGEIRDVETAEVAIQAALTGHLVFSTLHTNDAVGALTRLSDMGVQPFLVSAAVQGVVAQRLVRRLCSNCAEPYPAEPKELSALGLDPAVPQEFRRPRGCAVCEGVGFRGRIGLFELLELDGPLRDLVFERASEEDVARAAESSGRLRSLLTDGARKVSEGHTTVSEVLRVARAATDLDPRAEPV